MDDYGSDQLHVNFRLEALVSQGKEFWLGGLDSNQDTQSQSLVSYQLDDLPAVGGPATKTNRSGYPMIGAATIHPY